jgi:ABC-type Mn2+/Zn2+ transport system ATPase subunit
VTGAAAPIVEADGLAVGYRGTAVVDELTFTVRPGDLLALVGTNGSGKSTLLRTIVGLLPPVDGGLRVVAGGAQQGAGAIAYVGQSHRSDFVLPLRSRDLVRMGRYAARGLLGRFSPEDDRLVDDAMARMDVTDLASRPLTELSGGQQQRTRLAQALAHRAELLVLDEPTAGLDAAARGTYERAVAEERARGAAVVVATHDIGEAERASEVLLLAGRVVAQGAPATVLVADNLLDAFGVGLRRVGDSVLAGEEPHAHHDHTDRRVTDPRHRRHD